MSIKFIKINDNNNLDSFFTKIKEYYDESFHLDSDKNIRALHSYIRNSLIEQHKIITLSEENISHSLIFPFLNHFPNISILVINDQFLDNLTSFKKSDKTIYIGTTDDCDEFIDNQIIHFSQNKFLSFDESSLHSIINLLTNHIYVSINSNILSKINIHKFLTLISHKIIGLDITVLSNDHITCIKDLFITVFKIKKHTINIITENTEFLIYRPVRQSCPSDIGWFIFRLTLDELKKAISLVPVGEIIEIDICDDPCFLTRTTIQEQSQKSFYMSDNILDLALFPPEKESMCFNIII
jgi:hypothetical protein